MGHLTKEQRYTISVMLSQGFPQKEIAATIGRDKSVVSREIRRNSNPRTGRYSYIPACRRCEMRKRRLRRPRRFTPEMEYNVRKHLLMDYSPEQVVGHFRRWEWPVVSVQTIYAFIRRDRKLGGSLWRHCRHRCRLRHRPVGGWSPIKGRVSIDQRPPQADGTRPGDWEADLIVSPRSKEAVLTMVDRMTGFVHIRLLPNGKEADDVARKIIQGLKPYRNTLRTITTDNGTEFARHGKVTEELGVQVYFAHPYSSWEKGCVEYTNKLIRQYLTKKMSFSHVTERMLRKIEDRLNNRPRKKLGFYTPKEIFSRLQAGDNQLHFEL